MSDSPMPQQPQQTPEQPLAPEILTQELKQSIKNIKDARTQIVAKLEALKSEKDATKKSEIFDKLEEKITSGYQAVNEILSSFGATQIDVPALEDLIGNNFDIQSMYQSILDLELPALAEGEEVNQDEQDQKQAKLNAIKEQLTEIKQEAKGIPIGVKIGGGLIGVITAGSMVFGAVSAMQQGQQAEGERQANVATQLKDQSKINDAGTQARIDNFTAGKMTITNAEIFNQLVPGGNFQDNQPANLTPGQLIILNSKGITLDKIAIFYNPTRSIDSRNAMMNGDFGSFIKSASLDN